MRVWLALLAAAGLCACDAGPKAAPAHEQARISSPPAAYAPASSSSYGSAERPSRDPRDAPIPIVAGKPMWSANRDHTAQENARYHFEKDGADFGAKTMEDYVGKAHAFADKPPKGVLKLKRKNGDKLLYDPKDNVFVVVTKDGAPRTMFKPRKGPSYWETQMRKESGGDSHD